ncbi:hypothetical protein [Acrocarpospora catenulata]|uniref:hypothetical protein n=1 Tax=Acrocarpospora catenulata TaxID=2836182 RepID=UPI001BDB6579|nr:hypothetical protein [Acrocarpospora catenulata]
MPTNPATHLHEHRSGSPDGFAALAAARALANDLTSASYPADGYRIDRLQDTGLLAIKIGDPGVSPRVLTRIVTIIATADPDLAHFYRAHLLNAAGSAHSSGSLALLLLTAIELGAAKRALTGPDTYPAWSEHGYWKPAPTTERSTDRTAGLHAVEALLDTASATLDSTAIAHVHGQAMRAVAGLTRVR